MNIEFYNYNSIELNNNKHRNYFRCQGFYSLSDSNVFSKIHEDVGSNRIYNNFQLEKEFESNPPKEGEILTIFVCRISDYNANVFYLSNYGRMGGNNGNGNMNNNDELFILPVFIFEVLCNLIKRTIYSKPYVVDKETIDQLKKTMKTTKSFSLSLAKNVEETIDRNHALETHIKELKTKCKQHEEVIEILKNNKDNEKQNLYDEVFQQYLNVLGYGGLNPVLSIAMAAAAAVDDTQEDDTQDIKRDLNKIKPLIDRELDNSVRDMERNGYRNSEVNDVLFNFRKLKDFDGSNMLDLGRIVDGIKERLNIVEKCSMNCDYEYKIKIRKIVGLIRSLHYSIERVLTK